MIWELNHIIDQKVAVYFNHQDSGRWMRGQVGHACGAWLGLREARFTDSRANLGTVIIPMTSIQFIQIMEEITPAEGERLVW